MQAHFIDPECAGEGNDEYVDLHGFATRPPLFQYDRRWRITRWISRKLTSFFYYYQQALCLARGKWPPYSSIEEGVDLDENKTFTQTTASDLALPERTWLHDKQGLAVLLCDDEMAWNAMAKTTNQLVDVYNVFTPGNAETRTNETILNYCKDFPRRAVVIIVFGATGELLYNTIQALRDVENEMHVYTISTTFLPDTILRLRECQCINIRYTFATSLDDSRNEDQTASLPFIFENTRHLYDYRLTFIDSLDKFSEAILEDMKTQVLKPSFESYF